MQAQLNKILEEAKAQLQAAETLAQAEELRIKVLGKKGQLTEILRGMGKLSPEERACEGLFLSMQYPVEIPGVPVTSFLKHAVNAIRSYKGESELDTMEFIKNLAALITERCFSGVTADAGRGSTELFSPRVLVFTSTKHIYSLFSAIISTSCPFAT